MDISSILANQSLQEAPQASIPAKKDWLPLIGVDALLSAWISIKFQGFTVDCDH